MKRTVPRLEQFSGMIGGALLLGTLGFAPVAGCQSAPLRPGTRALLDAHNAYPERGQWTDRLARALSTGTPIAIEQDLYWGRTASGSFAPVVAHDDDALDGAPTLEAHFFDAIRPLMEHALRSNDRTHWPLIVLNLDFKENGAPLLDAVWSLLGRHAHWLTTAPRTRTPSVREPLQVGPLLVLVGADSAQRRRFHDDVAVDSALRAFGAMPPVPVPGKNKAARLARTVRMSATTHIPTRADNYARWVNFPWSVVERGGQAAAGPWTAADATRLRRLVDRAHALDYWIRFYTLDGFLPAADQGWTAAYNFGSPRAVAPRWRAALAAGVDFIATDQYEAFAEQRRRVPRSPARR